jgi:hypothetical protein
MRLYGLGHGTGRGSISFRRCIVGGWQRFGLGVFEDHGGIVGLAGNTVPYRLGLMIALRLGLIIVALVLVGSCRIALTLRV